MRKSYLRQNFQSPLPYPRGISMLARQSTGGGGGEVNIKNVVSGLLLIISLGGRTIRKTDHLRCSIYSHFPTTLNLTAEKMSQSCITSVLFSLWSIS